MSSSKLAVGIVGLPNVGKSTLFNALMGRAQAYAANFPFATIEPNVGVVPVPDERLGKLAEIYNSPIVYATIEFVDIAGLIAGAHKGEGLGNKFLHHIREVDAILHVVRAFNNENIIKEGSIDPRSDFETINRELELADLESIEKREKKKNKVILEELPLLAQKPFLIALNTSEDDLKKSEELESKFATELGIDKNQVVAISAILEEQLAQLSPQERASYLLEIGIQKYGLERIIKKAFSTLNLITFLTAGEKEVRAWTIKDETTAQKAAGEIHTDFEKKFIKADVADFEDFVSLGGWKNAREKGKVRQEGRDYRVKDGDVVEFKVGA